MSIKRDTVEARKGMPLARGVLDYFPDALLVVAEVSRVGNEQHHPGEPMHWDKSKSTDEADALLRHLLDRGTIDTDGLRHSAKVAWRALALLQRELDAEAATTPKLSATYMGMDLGSDADDRFVLEGVLPPQFVEGPLPSLTGQADLTCRGEWPPDTRVAGLLTCCGQTEHDVACPQWR